MPRTRSPRPASPAEELGFTVVGLGTYSREFAREVREAAEALRRRGPDHRRLSGSRGQGRRTAARTGAGHADGAAYRQAPGDSLRGHFGARARAGFPGALFAANGLRRRQRHFRHLGASPDDGSGRASADDVSRRFRVQRRRPRLALGIECPAAPHARAGRRTARPRARDGVGAARPRRNSARFHFSCAARRAAIPSASPPNARSI